MRAAGALFKTIQECVREVTMENDNVLKDVDTLEDYKLFLYGLKLHYLKPNDKEFYCEL